MPKLKREAHALYMKPASGTLSPAYYLLGKGIDDMSVEMNGSFEQTKDVTGDVSVSDTGYAPQVSVEPYHADPADSIYDFLKDIAMNRKSGDDCKVKILEVLIDKTDAGRWRSLLMAVILPGWGSTSIFGMTETAPKEPQPLLLRCLHSQQATQNKKERMKEYGKNRS